MGPFSRFRQSGEFIRAWEARYGSLSKAELLMMRDRNLGLFTAWTEISPKTTWTADEFIANFSSWGQPPDVYFEYLLAYRTVLRSRHSGIGAVIVQWREQVGEIADYYPPSVWAEEWREDVSAGRRNQGSKGGRTAGPGEVILGSDALQLVEEQLSRDALTRTH